MLAYYVDSFDPFIFHITANVGPRWYGMAYVLAFACSYALLRVLAKRGFADLSPAQLRDELRLRYGGAADQPVLTISSFAFARGISRTADLVFDMRFLPNPHWIDDLRPLTGQDRAVRSYLEQEPAWGETMERIEKLLIDWIPRYWAAGKSYVTVAFGCTGGRHRSVAAAVEMAERLRRAGFAPNVRHRDLASPLGDTIERHFGRAAASEDELSR